MKTQRMAKATTSGSHEQAASWFGRLREAPRSRLSAEDLWDWEQFIAEPSHRDAFDCVRRATNAAHLARRARLPTATELASDRYDGSVSVSCWYADQAPTAWKDREARAAGWKARLWGWRTWLASAAVITALAFLARGYYGHRASMPSQWDRAFATAAGEHRDVSLPDGSKIVLGAQSSVNVRYTEARRVVILEHGEALFTVAHNRARPFDVLAGSRAVRAVGTQFNVRRDLDRTVVTVTEGTVEVMRIDAGSSPVVTGPRAAEPESHARPARLTRGQEIAYTDAGPAGPVASADIAAATAWRNGQLVYRHVALKYVIGDVNRYFQQQIEIADQACGDLQYTGTVFPYQPVDEFLASLEKIFPVEVVRVDEQHVVIRSRPERARESEDR